MDIPQITAIIPTFKRPQLLKRAVRSVLAQTYLNFQILITDNASGKETDAVTEKFLQQDKRIKLLKHPTNMGAIANFNTALMQTTTPYVCFLPDDDFFAPFFFEEALTKFSQYPEIAFCGGGCLSIDQKYEVRSITSKKQSIPPCGYYHPPSGLFTYLRSSFGIAFPSLLFKTKIVQELGGFDLRIRNGGDEHLISQCSARYPVYLLTDRPFYFGFQHEGSLSSEIDYPLFEREAAYLYENMASAPLSSEEREEIELFFRKRQLKILSNAYRHFSHNKEFSEAKVYAKKIGALNPSFRWKSKTLQADIYRFFPFLAKFYTSLKTIEKTIRCAGKPKEIPHELNQTPHPEAALWKAYAHSLEQD